MRAHFSPMQQLIICVLISLITIPVFAIDKKKKSEPESKTPSKSELKSQAKNSDEKKADPKKEKSEKSKPQVVKNNKEAEADKKSLKSKSDLVAERSTKKSQEKEKEKAISKTASRQPEPKVKPAKTEVAVKSEKNDKKTSREEKSQESKEKVREVIVTVEKKAKPLAFEKPESAKLAKKPTFEESLRESTAVRELPRAGKFQFHPVVKASPKIQLDFKVSSALAAAAYEPPPPVSYLDIIEVYESGSAETQVLEEIRRQEIARLSSNPIPNVSNKKIDLKKMDQDRISQIQEALFKRGYYVGSPNGNYDEFTVQAMRKFQQEHRVDVTGYPTAQSLKLLGLVDYEPRFE
jgi:Putative peptidoglycan binding domain